MSADRERLAAVLRAFDAETGAGIPDDELADALLPVVQALVAEGMAAARIATLSELADDVTRTRAALRRAGSEANR